MKKKLLILSLLIIILSGCTGGSDLADEQDKQATEDYSSWQEYANNDFKYKVKYPPGWIVIMRSLEDQTYIGLDLKENKETACFDDINCIEPGITITKNPYGQRTIGEYAQNILSRINTVVKNEVKVIANRNITKLLTQNITGKTQYYYLYETNGSLLVFTSLADEVYIDVLEDILVTLELE